MIHYEYFQPHVLSVAKSLSGSPLTSNSLLNVMPHIVIFENQQLVSEGISLVLKGDPDNHVLHTAAAEAQLMSFLERHADEVDLILMDIELDTPDRTGLDVAYVVRERFPLIRIIFLTSYKRCEYIVPVFGQFEGYVFKDVHPQILRKAISDVTTAGKGTYYDTDAMNLYYQCMQNKRPKLSSEMVQTLVYMANGYTNPEIAEKMTTPERFLTENSIRERRRKLRVLLNAQNSAHIIARAFQMGYLDTHHIT